MSNQNSESIHWDHIGDPNLYRYRDHGGGPINMPVLMVDLSEEGPALWDLFSVMLLSDGFRNIYACRLPDTSPLIALMRTVERVLQETEASWIILLAYGPAAAQALHYIEENHGYYNVRMLICFNGEYKRNALSFLQGSLIENNDLSATPHPGSPQTIDAEMVNHFIMLNIQGQAPTSYLDPDRNISPLPEAVNIGLNLHPSQIMQSSEVYETALRPFLGGNMWLLQLHLRAWQIRVGATEAPVGRFIFEVESQRVPPDGMFTAPDQTDHIFEHYTPLGTVAIPARPGLQAANINFRLREIGRSAPKRRTLMSNIHVPLIDGKASDHNMQDSFGSEIHLRVHCARAPRIIPTDELP